MLELRAINKSWQLYERCKELSCCRAVMFQQYLAVSLLQNSNWFTESQRKIDRQDNLLYLV